VTAHYADATVTLHHGSCLDVLAELPDASVDSVCTDPPYGLANTDPAHVAETITRWVNGERDYLPGGSGFMGKAWDAFVPPVAVWDECLRVLKPGGHVLAFAGSRTVDLMTLGLRLAGFDIRDSVAWLYGSGFPKSLDVSKAIDKRGGNAHLADEIGAAIKAARESRGWTTGRADRHFCGGSTNWTWYEGRKGMCRPPTPADFARIASEWPELAQWAEQVAEADREVIGQSAHKSGIGNAAAGHYTVGGTVAQHVDVTAPATDDARTWQGWGTALKPAFEPVVVARKPLAGTVAANVLAHGTGALNIDGCRVDSGADYHDLKVTQGGKAGGGFDIGSSDGTRHTTFAPAAGRWPANVVLDGPMAAVLDEQSGELTGAVGMTQLSSDITIGTTGIQRTGKSTGGEGVRDAGGASRFFYVAKADASERVRVDGIAHPTVKPLALMRWLVRLVTPPGGTVLEPFAGSGTTVEACILEGFRCVAIEREADYLPLITQRIHRRRDPVEAVKALAEDRGLFDLLNEETA